MENLIFIINRFLENIKYKHKNILVILVIISICIYGINSYINNQKKQLSNSPILVDSIKISNNNNISSQVSPTLSEITTPKEPSPTDIFTSTPIYNSGKISPYERNVMVIDFNPIIESQGSKRLREVESWQDPIVLENQYIKDIKTVSNDFINYKIINRQANIDVYPMKNNGYYFTDDSYFKALSGPDENARALIDYSKLLEDFKVCDKVNNGQINELWIWGGPWFGYQEVTMAGPDAYDTNGPPVLNSSCQKKLLIMGFSYERGISEMIENLGHAIEGTMIHVYKEDPRYLYTNHQTSWGKFALSDKVSPGFSSCGWMHFAPNSDSDYDWSNKNSVMSNCDDWLNYPNLIGETKEISCKNWNCDGYEFKKWWLSHLPKVEGQKDGYWNNWWKYLGN